MYQVSFGRISDQRVFESNDYQKWNDGVSIEEVTTSLIGVLTDEIGMMFGYDRYTVAKKWLYLEWENGPVVKSFFNAAMYYRSGHLVFNTRFFVYLANTCGVDVIVGILAHEIGHRLVYLSLQRSGRQIDDMANELCADFIAGLILRLSGRDLKPMQRLFTGLAADGGPHHPNGRDRIRAMEKGYTWIDRDRRGVFLRVTAFAKQIDTRQIFTMETLSGMFESEILNS